jgi:hypothetical protein
MADVSMQTPQSNAAHFAAHWNGHRSAPDPESDQKGQEIRVLLVEDHLAFRQPLAFMLMRGPLR